MKKILSITLLMILVNQSIVFAQEKNILLFGKIENSRWDTVYVSNPYGNYQAVTNQNGEYRLDLYTKNFDFFDFSLGKNQITLYLVLGDTLEMNFDKNNLSSSLSFKGKNMDINAKLFHVSRGKPAPGFALKDINGNIVKLSDFKGKYVYIDVWNSACYPCFKEFPLLEPIIEKYKEIVFLGVSLDKDEVVWKKTVQTKGLKGVQLFAEGWSSDFGNNYFVKFNPRFILIDKNQNILYLSAPRPSENLDGVLGKLN